MLFSANSLIHHIEDCVFHFFDFWNVYWEGQLKERIISISGVIMDLISKNWETAECLSNLVIEKDLKSYIPKISQFDEIICLYFFNQAELEKC